jgi:hypothetical protein
VRFFFSSNHQYISSPTRSFFLCYIFIFILNSSFFNPYSHPITPIPLPQVVSQACESLQFTLELLGACVLAPYLQPNWIISEEEPPCSLGAMQIILQMLHEKAPCQMQPIESLEQHAQAEDDEGVYVCVVAVFFFLNVNRFAYNVCSFHFLLSQLPQHTHMIHSHMNIHIVS